MATVNIALVSCCGDPFVRPYDDGLLLLLPLLPLPTLLLLLLLLSPRLVLLHSSLAQLMPPTLKVERKLPLALMLISPLSPLPPAPPLSPPLSPLPPPSPPLLSLSGGGACSLTIWYTGSVRASPCSPPPPPAAHPPAGRHLHGRPLLLPALR